MSDSFSGKLQLQLDGLVLSCPCRWCEQNWRKVNTVGDRKFWNCFDQSQTVMSSEYYWKLVLHWIQNYWIRPDPDPNALSLSVWVLVKSSRTSTCCRCWHFVYDNDYSILCSSGVQKLLTDTVCHQQLNIHSVAFLCVNYVILSSVSLRLHFVFISIAKCWQARVFWS